MRWIGTESGHPACPPTSGLWSSTPTVRRLAVGETAILLTLPLTPAKGRGGYSRVTVSPTAIAIALHRCETVQDMFMTPLYQQHASHALASRPHGPQPQTPKDDSQRRPHTHNGTSAHASRALYGSLSALHLTALHSALCSKVAGTAIYPATYTNDCGSANGTEW